MLEILALLESVPVLAGARPVRELTGGEASVSWLVADYEGKYVLRQDKPLAARLGLDRKSEWAVLQAAFAADLGPEPIWADLDRGLLLTRFIPGEAWRESNLDFPVKLAALGGLLRRVHAVPAAVRLFDPLAIAERYARQCGAAPTGTSVGEVAALSEQLLPPGMVRATCHGDPNAANIIGRDDPRLIDWEYAHAGDPLFDLAVVARYHALPGNAARWLFEAWAGGFDGEAWERLEAFGRLYDLLTGLWEQVVSAHTTM